MTKNSNSIPLKKQIILLESLKRDLDTCTNLDNKLQVIVSHSTTSNFLSLYPGLRDLISQLDIANRYLIMSVIAIGQGPAVFSNVLDENDISFESSLNSFLLLISPIEKCYESFGGIVGYHLEVIKRIDQKNTLREPGERENSDFVTLTYYEPEGIDFTNPTPQTKQKEFWAVRQGLEFMSEIAEIYPIGGAAERLNLQDDATGELLPAAQLVFCGKTLLEGLIRDLQGREYLHYKLFGSQLTTPIAAMTSHERRNHQRVLLLCEQQGWFGRGKDNFRFFIQPLVPMITLEGDWAMKSPLQPILKPGGHGLLWKSAADDGIFDWLKSRGYTKALVRQINNPIAGIDNGLLILSGIGSHDHKGFGFASCPRLLGSAEGMNVLRERKLASGEYDYCVTNVEYTEFEQQGLSDTPVKPGSAFSRLPANTNILFIDIKSIEEAITRCSIPGLLINTKSVVSLQTADGKIKEARACRLESTMQNIADYMVNKYPRQLPKGKRNDLTTFLTFNSRVKTISTVKQAFQTGESKDTPEKCFYELMLNYQNLLQDDCGMIILSSSRTAVSRVIPDLQSEYDFDQYLKHGPLITVLFHPALGGVFAVIAQKISGGRIHRGSEWVMEIAEAYVEDLDLDGSLIVEADAMMGAKDSEGKIIFDSEKCGKCTLINVKVKNRGLNPHDGHQAWKRRVERAQCAHIIIQGSGEFHAQDVTLEGDVKYIVPDGERWSVSSFQGKTIFKKEKIQQSTWKWVYAFDDNSNITLSRK